MSRYSKPTGDLEFDKKVAYVEGGARGCQTIAWVIFILILAFACLAAAGTATILDEVSKTVPGGALFILLV